MQEARIDLFTSTGLTKNQHWCIVLSNLEYLRPQALNHLTTANWFGDNSLLTT